MMMIGRERVRALLEAGYHPHPFGETPIPPLFRPKKRAVWRVSRQWGTGLAPFAKRLIAIAVIATCSATAAVAQAPVIDWTAIAYQIQQLQQAQAQLTNMEQQLTQAQQLYGSLNKLTNMGDVASLLNNPSIRRVLPTDFAAVEGLLTGNGTGAAGTAQRGFADANSYYQTPGNDFYAGELRSHGQRAAGYETVGQQMYDAASQRIDGIDQLRAQINQAQDPKTVMDLQARLQAESAFMQADTLRIGALRTVQQAQLEVQRQRGEEAWRKRLDTLSR